MSTPAVGMDLGTTNSVIAYIDASGRPVVIPNSEGNPFTPSVVYCGCDPPLVGEQAKEMQGLGEEDIGAFFKRSMGDPNFLLHLGDRHWTPVELSALVLGELKRCGEAALGCQIPRAVITVPAYFNSDQRKATIEAGRRAGLNVAHEPRIINEPTAAAIAHGLNVADKEGTILVYDLGGGTFDVSLVSVTREEIDVCATLGDHNLGGKDWDDRIASYIGEQFTDEHGVNPLENPVALNDLLVRSEAAKKGLSARQSTRLTMHHEGRRGTYELTRETFEELTRDLMERTQALCKQVLEENGVGWRELEGVLLVGGSTRMPMVHDYVERMSGKKPMTGVNVDEAVAMGAAILAGQDLQETTPAEAPRFRLAGSKRIRDATGHGLGVIAESSDRKRFVNSVIVPRNTKVPAQGEKQYQIQVGPGKEAECTVYVTEGEGEDPQTVAVRERYVCSGQVQTGEALAKIRVEIAYDRNNTIQVKAWEEGSGNVFAAEQHDVEDLSWLAKSPADLESFDPSSLTLMVNPSGCDDIGAILSKMGLRFKMYASGNPLECNVLFLNCMSDESPQPKQLRRFVEAGGCLYASCYMDDLVKAAFPSLFCFGGHRGRPCTMPAEVADPDLRHVLGNEINVTFDTPWGVLAGPSKEARILLVSKTTGKPLMAMAPYGQGTVFFTCFHNRAQASKTEETLLQMLVLKQISIASGVPIEIVARAKGVALRG